MRWTMHLATALLCALLCACGEDAPQYRGDMGAEKSPRLDEPMGDELAGALEDEFRVPDVWCGTGMRDRGHPLAVDSRPQNGEWSAWSEAGSSGICLRMRLNFVNGRFETERQYRRRKNGAWDTWSHAEELARRKRQDKKPKQPRGKAK